jgi:PncC family amidohydrolase
MSGGAEEQGSGGAEVQRCGGACLGRLASISNHQSPDLIHRDKATMKKQANQSTEQQPHPLAIEIGRLFRAHGLTLALAESCTGGLIGSLITDVPGSSDYFLGSAVTYAYSAKENILGVRHETLLAHGAVSAETAGEMAQGARRIFGADIAASVTGVAGPGGALPDKPIGLVYIHLSAVDAEIGERYVWDSDRMGNKRLSAEAVLGLVIRYLGEW